MERTIEETNKAIMRGYQHNIMANRVNIFENLELWVKNRLAEYESGKLSKQDLVNKIMENILKFDRSGLGL